jgi:hypothetical protein
MSQDGKTTVPENEFSLEEILSFLTGIMLKKNALLPLLTYMTGEKEAQGTFWMRYYGDVCSQNLERQFLRKFGEEPFRSLRTCLWRNLARIERECGKGTEKQRAEEEKFLGEWLGMMRERYGEKIAVLTLAEYACAYPLEVR